MAITPLSEYNLQDLFAKKFTYPEKKKIVIESESLELHQEGKVPTAMLNETRPGESLEAKAYRKKIFKSKTKNIFNRVVQSLSKIERSVDFTCYFNEKDISKRITKGETPKDYLTINYPFGSGNFIHYVFAELINVYVTEPMGLVLIAIDENDLTLQSNEYVKPKPIIFESDDILHFASDLSWAVLEADNCATYYNEGAKKTDGRVIYVVDSNVLQRYEQINSSGEMALKFEYKHGFNVCPIIQMKGAFKEIEQDYQIYESRLLPMINDLDEATREYSDLQAAKVFSLFPLQWEIGNQKCGDCGGNGIITMQDSQGAYTKKKCTSCEGKGNASKSPFDKIVINMADTGIGQNNVPTPPAGFVQRDIETIKVMNESVNEHLYNALCSVNMQHLNQVPLTQSGVAKAIDRDEQNNFCFSVQMDLVNIANSIAYFTNEYRYKTIVPSVEERAKLMPKFTIAQNFDLLNSQYLLDELKAASDVVKNPYIIAALQTEYAAKKFYTQPMIKDKTALVLELDPYINKTEDEKLASMQGGGASKEDYIISTNIYPFVQRALEENPNFGQLKYSEKMTKMLEFAKEKISAVKLIATPQMNG